MHGCYATKRGAGRNGGARVHRCRVVGEADAGHTGECEVQLVRVRTWGGRSARCGRTICTVVIHVLSSTCLITTITDHRLKTSTPFKRSQPHVITSYIKLATIFLRGSPIPVVLGWPHPILPRIASAARRPQAMSEVVESNESNPAPENLSDFLSAQRSGYLKAVGQGETQRDVWTVSMGNEAGGWF